MSPSPMPLPVQVGQVLAGKFRIERVIGEGGMGVVTEATHLGLDERVALKFLRREVMQLPEVVGRFDREARAAVKLKSEHVARVSDVGKTDDGIPYMVMELLVGKDLGQMLTENGPLPVSEAVEYIIQACEGVNEAHARGIVHRDLKPENLFVVQRSDTWNLVKVLDFGISKAVLVGPSSVDMASHNTSSIMGSPYYMSPEQLRSTRSVDHRTDVWSLGAVLFELLTATTIFDETREFTELVANILESEHRRLTAFRPDAPVELEEIVDRCLEKDRTRRFANVAELSVALLPFAPRRARVTVERTASIARAAGLITDPNFQVPPSVYPPAGNSDSFPGVITPPPTRVPADLMVSSAPPPQRASNPPHLPTTLGQFRPLAQLGQGGMARVLLVAREGPANIQKLLVVKEIREELAHDPEFVTMFMDEARLATRMSHPNVVQTFDVATEGSHCFMVMEYLEGHALHAVLSRVKRKLPLGVHLRILGRVLAGLHYAHELRGFDGKPMAIVHRDVSPQNTILCYDGQVKLVDFGIAKAAGAASRTIAGMFKGKLGYVAPEQIAGTEIDRRADIFSVGIMLWEALVGRRLTYSESEAAIMHRRTTGTQPRVLDARPEADVELAWICDRAMALGADDRFETAQDMLDALEARMDALGMRSTDAEIGRLVSEAFAQERQALLALIERQLALPAQPSSDFSGVARMLAGDAAQGLHPSDPPRRTDASLPPATSTSALSDELPRLRPSRARVALLASAAVLVVGGTVVGITAFANSTKPAAAGVGVPLTAATAMPSQGSPAPADTVDVTIEVSPARAKITLDGKDVGRSPFHGTLPKDTTAHQLYVVADGYAPEMRAIQLDRDVRLELALRPAAPPRVTVQPAAVMSAPRDPTGGDLTVARPKHTIDEKDPY